MAYSIVFGSYSGIKISKLKNIHIPQFGVTKSYLGWGFKIATSPESL